MAQTLAAVFELTDRYTANIKKIIQAQEEYEKKQERIDKATDEFNAKMGEIGTAANKGAGGLNTLIGRMSGLVSVAYLAKKALDGTFAAINTAALQKVQETTFQALLKSDEAGSALYKYVGAYAKVSALGREDVAKGVTSFMTVTRDIDQIERLIKMTERLYAKDPTQGAEGAVFALKEALAGDVLSMRNRYGITGLSGESLRAADAAGKIDQIDAALNQFGATQEVVDRNFNSLSVQSNIFATNLKTEIGEQATPVMNNLAQVMARLNANMEAGKYQPFINLMVNGMRLIGNGIAWVMENADKLIPGLGGVVMGLLAYKAASAAAAFWSVIMKIAVDGLIGNWAEAIGILAGVTAAAWGLSAAFSSIDAQIDTTSLDEYKSAAGTAMQSIPVEIANEDPLKVTGEVEIEQENMKYLMDIAGARFFAQYSTATLAPQYIVQNQTITKDADWMEGYRVLGDMVKESAASMPGGVYDG